MKTKAVRLAGKHALEWVDRDLSPREGEVVVRCHQTSVCDADLRAWQGKHMPEDLPGFEWIGHEGGGEVVEVGPGVREFKVGDHVMCFGPNNAWAEYWRAHADTLVKAPEGMDMDIACLGEPISVGMYGVFETNTKVGDDAAVVGLNFQGLLAVQAIKRSGAGRVIAIDYSDRHLEIAKARGADIVINTTKTDAVAEVREITKGRGCDVVYHSCGYWNPRHEEYFNIGCDVVKDEGTYVSVPDLMTNPTARLHRLHHHAIDMKFAAIMHHNPHFLKMWVPRVMRPVAMGYVDVEGLLTASFALNEFEAAIRKFDEDPDQVKVRMKP